MSSSETYPAEGQSQGATPGRRLALSGLTLRTRLLTFLILLIVGSSLAIGAGSLLAVNRFLSARLDGELRQAALNALPGARVSPTPATPPGVTPGSDSAVTVGPTASSPPTGNPGEHDDEEDPRYGRGIEQRGLSLGTVIYHSSGGAVVEADTRLLVSDGTTIALSPSDQQRLARVPADSSQHSIELGENLGHYRVLALSNARDTWVIGVPMGGVEHTVRTLATGLATVTLAAITVAVLLGSALIRFTLRPLTRVTATALRVSRLPLSAGDAPIDERVPDRDTDPRTEVGQVGTALNALLDHIAAALAARQASEDRVRRFVSDASHELRTPLASIRGYAELAGRTREEVPADVAHALTRVQSQAERMTALVEDLLLLARLDERRPLERAEVDLTSMLVDALSDAHAAGPEHIWRLDLPGEPVIAIGDAHRLHQVVANLLTNARTHTPGGTTVTAGVRAEHESDTAVLTVSDTGPGIPASLQSEVFERFARGDTSRTRAVGSAGAGSPGAGASPGTGLGLAIVAAVVAAHEGTVSVSSHPGSTVFTVRLPLHPMSPEDDQGLALEAGAEGVDHPEAARS